VTPRPVPWRQGAPGERPIVRRYLLPSGSRCRTRALTAGHNARSPVIRRGRSRARRSSAPQVPFAGVAGPVARIRQDLRGAVLPGGKVTRVLHRTSRPRDELLGRLREYGDGPVVAVLDDLDRPGDLGVLYALPNPRDQGDSHHEAKKPCTAAQRTARKPATNCRSYPLFLLERGTGRDHPRPPRVELRTTQNVRDFID